MLHSISFSLCHLFSISFLHLLSLHAIHLDNFQDKNKKHCMKYQGCQETLRFQIPEQCAHVQGIIIILIYSLNILTTISYRIDYNVILYFGTLPASTVRFSNKQTNTKCSPVMFEQTLSRSWLVTPTVVEWRELVTLLAVVVVRFSSFRSWSEL